MRKPSLANILSMIVAMGVFRPAFAQAAPNIEAVGHIGDLVRWGGVLSSVFIVAGAWALLRILSRFVTAFSEKFSARRLTLQKLYTIIQFLIFVSTTIVVIALSFRIERTVLTLIGGTAAVAIGFALKDLAASFIAGIIVMLDRPFQVGDRVTFGGVYGDITAIGLRSVRLQTLDDNTVTIPNNKFLSEITISGNYGALDMQVDMDFYIGADQDVDLAREILKEAALSSRYIFLAKPVVVLVVQSLTDNLVSIRLRLKAYVLDTRHEKAFETDVNLRCLRAFKEAGINPPTLLYRLMA